MNLKIKLYFLLPTLLLTNSCVNETNDVIKENVKTTKDIKLDSFLISVDNLNKNYTPYATKSGAVRKWGTRFLSAVVDGCTGVVASAATTPIGGTLIGTGASWAYEEYLDNILDTKAFKKSKSIINSAIPAVILSEKKESTSFIDSVGYYHNKILAKLSNSNKVYIDKNGSINSEKLFTDISTIMRQYGIKTENIDKKKQLAFSTSIETFIKKLNLNNIKESFQGFETEKNTLELSENEIYNIKIMCQKVVQLIPYLNNEKAVEYGKELYKIIESSNLTEQQKQDFKVLDNIFINSKLYWETIKQ